MNFTKPLFATLLMAFPHFAAAEQGITDDSVTFAQVAAFEGPAAALGTGMRLGITAAFEEVNAAGGVHGRTVQLDAMDDGYEPDRSAALVKTVVDENNHIGLIGPVGTPTTSATQPIASAANMPFIGPFTGAGFLRDASHGNIFNVRATYHAETEAWIDYLVDQQGMESIAILYQDDGFGRVGLAGVNAALEKRNMTLAAEGTYTRNTTAVKKALLSIRKAKPDAVVMVGAYKPVAEFIKLSRKMKIDATFVNISFVGSDALAQELGDAGEGVIISQVVPLPWDASVPIVAQYTKALAAADASAKPGFVSLEGYIVGRLAIEGLEAAGKELTRESYLQALSTLTTVDLGGVTMTFGSDDNQGMDDVFMTRITADGGFEPISPAEES
ncbi:ABC transporter substrate-binding protein [Tritonibacter scottomollicae]|uniref:ABC transporter substrate-binding protein n=1 Tax=Tritonibacter scottomollicae TaxID=483013 RepID=A0ABZ0HGP2_TRISK|nr:ABC transporter substrate-binding protein [Tritonibacter scottomollicae]WOI33393.1 ABC transporter substrate-binding protein [Tritonibacter scottomollicae]